MEEATEDADEGTLLCAFRLAERNRLKPLPPLELDSSAGDGSVLAAVDGCLILEANDRNDIDIESIEGLGGSDLFH